MSLLRGDIRSLARSDIRSLARRAAEVLMSLAVIVMFAGLLAVPDTDEAARCERRFAGEQPA
jgi:hypothetical protein